MTTHDTQEDGYTIRKPTDPEDLNFYSSGMPVLKGEPLSFLTAAQSFADSHLHASCKPSQSVLPQTPGCAAQTPARDAKHTHTGSGRRRSGVRLPGPARARRKSTPLPLPSTAFSFDVDAFMFSSSQQINELGGTEERPPHVVNHLQRSGSHPQTLPRSQGEQ